jgi:hypothetical protein
VDPGFQDYPLYQQVYKGHTTGDKKYALPDGFEAIRDYGCALDFSSHVYYSSSTFKQDLDKEVTTGFHIPFLARFQSSHDWNDFHSRTLSENQRMVTSAAECVVYKAALDTFHKPSLSDDFKGSIDKLPTEYADGEAFFDLFDAFGTHSVQKAKMGSRYGFTSYFDEKDWTNVERIHTSVSHAASVFGFYTATREGNTTTTIDVFKQNMQSYKEMSLGAKPVAKGDADSWARQVIQQPMPISYTLDIICDAIGDVGKKASCLKGLSDTEYCTKRLIKKKKVIESCHPPAKVIECLWDGDCRTGICLNRKCDSNPQTVAWRPSKSTLCLTIVGGGRISLEKCNGGANQKWIFNAGEYENYMQIQYASDTNQCLDGSSMNNGAPLVLVHCNGGPSQTWAREISMGSVYLPNGVGGNVCIDAGSGVKAGSALMIWQCNVLPQQQYDLLGHKSHETLVLV